MLARVPQAKASYHDSIPSRGGVSVAKLVVLLALALTVEIHA